MARETREEKDVRLGWRMAGLAGETASHVLAGVLLGWGASELFGGDYWIIVGGGLGIVTGIAGLIRGGLKLNNQLDLARGKRPSQSRSDDEAKS